MTVGERIKAARKKAGLTQLDVAYRLGDQSYQSVAQWERGVRAPKLESLERLAEAIGCPLSDLTHDPDDGLRDVEQMKAIVERERLAWKSKIFENIRLHDFDRAKDKLTVLQGIEFLAEALDLMEGNMAGRFALSDLIADAEANYILAQEGETNNAARLYVEHQKSPSGGTNDAGAGG